jgi:hypothetical protein
MSGLLYRSQFDQVRRMILPSIGANPAAMYKIASFCFFTKLAAC